MKRPRQQINEELRAAVDFVIAQPSGIAQIADRSQATTIALIVAQTLAPDACLRGVLRHPEHAVHLMRVVAQVYRDLGQWRVFVLAATALAPAHRQNREVHECFRAILNNEEHTSPSPRGRDSQLNGCP